MKSMWWLWSIFLTIQIWGFKFWFTGKYFPKRNKKNLLNWLMEMNFSNLRKWILWFWSLGILFFTPSEKKVTTSISILPGPHISLPCPSIWVFNYINYYHQLIFYQLNNEIKFIFQMIFAITFKFNSSQSFYKPNQTWRCVYK